MTTMILHPTDVSQWYTLVSEAELTTSFMLDEALESYLVFLLMRFSRTTDWIESVLALDYLELVHVPRLKQYERLRQLGDKSLLFSGLFSELADQRHVKLEYYTEMGRLAYLRASEMHIQDSSELYFNLSEQFVALQSILKSLRGQSRCC